ncbi:MAG: hypothetical protein ACHQFZ_01200 [Acidimicrobiales bacterium]
MTLSTPGSVRDHLRRSPRWHGVRAGDPVTVDGPRERRLRWVFLAHVVNEATGEEWVEVRGGRPGEAKGRAFRTEAIYPGNARRGSRLVGPSLAVAPQLPLE